MNSTERLFALVPFISTHQGISMKELASEFGISQKELVADLETLFLCGLPGYTPLELMELSFEDGFVYIRNADDLRKPRKLTNAEALYLLIGLSFIRDSYLNMREDCEKLIDRIHSMLSASVVIESHDDLLIGQTIEKALHDQKRLMFRYLSIYRDEARIREVSPIALIHRANGRYLSAFCHTVGALRTFKTDRISEIRVLETTSSWKESSTTSIKASIHIHRRLRKHRYFFNLEGDSGEFETFDEGWLIRAIIATGGDVQLRGSMSSAVVSRAKAALALNLEVL